MAATLWLEMAWTHENNNVTVIKYFTGMLFAIVLDVRLSVCFYDNSRTIEHRMMKLGTNILQVKSKKDFEDHVLSREEDMYMCATARLFCHSMVRHLLQLRLMNKLNTWFGFRFITHLLIFS